MKLIYPFIPLIFLVSVNLSAQIKVASFSVGKLGTDQYENLSFWTKDGKPSEVHYSYGKTGKDLKLEYGGKAMLHSDTALIIRFPNNFALYVIPQKLKLKVVDLVGKYNKTFSWEYEGPVNGVGTYCSVCAQDDEDAMKMIRETYLK